MRRVATDGEGRRAGPAPGAFLAGFSLSCTDSLEPSSFVPSSPAIAALAAFSVAMSTNP
jgi:hypothetical protein